jgi:hypothetical protein
MNQDSRSRGRSSEQVPTVVRWVAVVVSTGLTGLLLLGLLLVWSEYRPSAVNLLQQVVVAFVVATLSMCVSVYLLVRPLSDPGQSLVAYIALSVAIVSALAVYVRPTFVWDFPALLFVAFGVLSTVTCVSVVVSSVRGPRA